ncbi:MAG: lytic transglycosylase domain-containing protein [Opitutaceae bacterium]|nr:lytic transglycosylase domain-containing protein [Opitutaceae bacterium]
MSLRHLLLLPLTAVAVLAAEPAPAPADTDDLFTMGQALFEALAPPEIKEEFAFPTRAQWDEFAARLEKTRESGSLAELAAYEPEARTALLALRVLPEYKDYADWLEERIDEIVVAKRAVTPAPPPPPVPPVDPALPPIPPTPPPVTPASSDIPLYDLWVGRVRERPRPARADEFLAELKTVFRNEGLPVELAWIPETESMFNPAAKSPAGARGLFQLMPVTAKAQGLSLFPFDERVHPEKSARAAATLLRRLHGMFNSWPLALAAYNAGEGRVRRTLKTEDAKTFAEIADALPTETRLYVPKVLATLAVREGIDPAKLAAPTAPALLRP